MQTLPSGIKKVEASDNATVANFNVNAELLDAKIILLDNHKQASELDHPNGSVTTAKIAAKAVTAATLADNAATDTVIGTRSLDDTVMASGGADTPTRLWSKLGNMIKGITGSANWWTLPTMTITAIITSLSLKAPLASPALTGSPTAPTTAAGDNSTKIATTAFVAGQNYVKESDVMIKGMNNQAINKVMAIGFEVDTRSTIFSRDTSNRVTIVEKKDGAVVLMTTTLTRDLTGAVISFTETAGGTTKSYVINRDPITQLLTSITKS